MVVIWSNEETQKELAISVKEQKLPPSPSHTTCGLISNITLNMIKAKDPISFYTVNYNNLFLKKKFLQTRRRVVHLSIKRGK
jgi:hypothetical protein